MRGLQDALCSEGNTVAHASTRPKVLVVDDQHNNLVALRRLLAKVDADIFAVQSGKEALSLVGQYQFALILLDVQMPEMDGYAVAARLRAAEATEGLPIIFLTAAYRDEAHRIQGYHAGAVDYLDKPINDVVLLSKVRVFLDLHRHRLEQERLLAEVYALNDCLKAVNTTLEEKVSDLEGFSYAISHDLRAPLRAINGFAGILREEFSDTLGGDADGLVKAIQGNSVHMSHLLDDLLAFFRITSAPLNSQPVDLGRLAREVTDACCGQGRYSHSEVVVAPLPIVTGDETALRLVLHNLIDNALKYSAGREKPRIEIGFGAADEGVRCFVRDNGIGFESNYSGKLFRVFERLVTGAEYEGNGVGLAIVERIVRRHSGRVWAEGAPGEGATFHFTLPLAKAAA